MSLLEPSNHTTADPECFTIAEVQGKVFRAAFMNMVEVFKRELNISLKEMYENKKRVEGNQEKSSRLESGR